MTTLVNWEKVNELCGEIGEEDFDEVVVLFMEEVEDTLGQVGDDGRSLEHDLHFLKGSALNLGFWQFSQLCKAGEAAAAAGDGNSVCISEIRDSYHASRAFFLDNLKDKLAS